jgi:uncharacterized protein YcnI
VSNPPAFGAGRLAGVTFGVLVLTVALAAPASAHVEFEPAEAAPGSVITLELALANEESDAGTTGIDLRFPEGQPLVVAELPAAAGWTATVQGGAVGGEATGVTWTRPTASPDEGPLVSVRLGPLPAAAGRLQFKLLQSYSNGAVHRWIDEWPAGGAEPEMPGPVLDLVAGGPGDVPAVTTSSTAAATTAAPTTTSTSAPGPTTTAAPDDDDEDGGVPVVPIVLAVLVVGGGAAYFLARRRRGTP